MVWILKWPNIHGDSDGIGLGITNPAKDFHIHGTTPTVRLTAGGFTSGVDFLMDTGGTGYIGNRNNGKIQIFTNGTATVDFLANQNTFFYGNISGSATSTGSFGGLETAGNSRFSGHLDMGTKNITNWNTLQSQGNLYLDNGGFIDSRGSGDLTFRTTDSVTTRMVIKNAKSIEQNGMALL